MQPSIRLLAPLPYMDKTTSGRIGKAELADEAERWCIFYADFSPPSKTNNKVLNFSVTLHLSVQAQIANVH